MDNNDTCGIYKYEVLNPDLSNITDTQDLWRQLDLGNRTDQTNASISFNTTIAQTDGTVQYVNLDEFVI